MSYEAHTPKEVLAFWFGDPPRDQSFWFSKDKNFDLDVKMRFESLLKEAKLNKLDSWGDGAHGRLALIVLLDQFSRNIYRGTAASFESDEKAQNLVLEGISMGLDMKLPIIQRAFFYMPLMHAEDLELQGQSVIKFAELEKDGGKNLKWAIQHKEVIDKFGRFPHRNSILGRKDTHEEKEYLLDPTSGF